MKDFWNQRYSEKIYVYGTDANAFFRDFIKRREPGCLLLPAEGEGRNAVFAALNGWKVDAFDYSEKAAQKALALARHNKVDINYRLARFEDLDLDAEKYDLIALIYAHLHEDIRRSVHRKLVDYLKPGGTLFLEAFSKNQIHNDSGGPRNEAMLYDTEELAEDFSGLSIELLEQRLVELDEGKYHRGTADVIRLIAHKPAA